MTLPKNPMVAIMEGKCEACGGAIEVLMAPLPKRYTVEINCRQPTDCVLQNHLALIGRRLVSGQVHAVVADPKLDAVAKRIE